jgi:hypothetical protein
MPIVRKIGRQKIGLLRRGVAAIAAVRADDDQPVVQHPDLAVGVERRVRRMRMMWSIHAFNADGAV